jgi:hypothetical protein
MIRCSAASSILPTFASAVKPSAGSLLRDSSAFRPYSLRLHPCIGGQEHGRTIPLTDVGDEFDSNNSGPTLTYVHEYCYRCRSRRSRHEAAEVGRWVADGRDAVGAGATADERYDFAWEIVSLAMPPLLIVGCR